MAQRPDRQSSADAGAGLAGIGQCIALAMDQLRFARFASTLQNQLIRSGICPHRCPVSQICFFFGEWLLLPGKAPRQVIAGYGEERQRSMATTDAAKKEQYL
jgi:hypothetical protein